MKKTLLAASVFAVAMSSAAFAQYSPAGTTEGDIRFTGEVTDAACTLDATAPLNLGSVSTSTLKAAGDISRMAQTELRFRDCDVAKASAIEISINSAAADATIPELYKNQGTAQNVGVALWFDGQRLSPDGSTAINDRQIGVAGGDVTFVVQGQMQATGVATPGTVDGVLGFKASYK